MKTAVCFTGQCRSLEFTYDNIKENLINCLGDCDIFGYIAENASSHKAVKYLNFTELAVRADPVLDLDEIRHMQAPSRGGINGYMQMLYGMKKCLEMVKDYEKKHDMQYERIIRSRLDVKYFNKLESSFDLYEIDKYIYTPDFHCWSVVQGAGHNDRFAVGNRENMSIYLSEFDYIKQYSSLGHTVHAESTLHYHLNRHEIPVKRVPIRFTRVRPGGFEEDLHLNSNPLMWPEGEGCQ